MVLDVSASSHQEAVARSDQRPQPKVTLTWTEFASISEAMEKGYGKGRSFVYVVATDQRTPLYVGMASKGFQARYRGGTHNAIDAALDSSGKVVLVTEVAKRLLRRVERQLIFDFKPRWNVQDKRKAPRLRLRIEHAGQAPVEEA